VARYRLLKLDGMGELVNFGWNVEDPVDRVLGFGGINPNSD